MSGFSIVIVLAVVLSGVLLWLLIPRRKPSEKPATSAFASGLDALPSPRHYAYFPQIRQALSREDAEYLRKNAPQKAARQALRERRSVARRFLRGLNEDFSALAKMGRVIAALSPEVSHKQETERLMLSLRFQVVYALVWLRLWSGALPLHQLEVLTGLVGQFATRIDQAMTEISVLSAQQLAGKLGA